MLRRLSVGLLVAMMLHAAHAEGPMPEEPPTEAPAHAHRMARSMQLYVAVEQADLEALAVPAPPQWRGWELLGDQPALELRLGLKGKLGQSVTWLISPWQDMRRAADHEGERAAVLVITEHAIVLGPIAVESANPAFVQRASDLMNQMTLREAYDRSIPVGQVHTNAEAPAADAPPVVLKPHAVLVPHHLVAQADPLGAAAHEPSWHDLSAEQVAVQLDEQGEAVALYAPRAVDRSRPRPFDPGEQRLSPDVDLKAEGQRMDENLRRLFVDAIEQALALPEQTREARERIYEQTLPALHDVVFTYAGHTGPAFAAGAQALERRQRELHATLVDPTLLEPRNVHPIWPGGLPTHAPHLIADLLALPPAEPEALPALLSAFDAAQARAAEQPGDTTQPGYRPSDAELLCAELGDRLRTAARAATVEQVHAALNGRDAIVRYQGYRLRSNGEPRPAQRPHSTDGPIELTVDLLQRSDTPAPLGPMPTE